MHNNKFHRILVGTDYSDSSRNAQKYAAALAKHFGAEILLFHSYHVPVPATDMPEVIIANFEEVKVDEETRIREEAKLLSEREQVKVITTVKAGFAAEQILEIASSEHADLVVMGMKETGKLKETLLGSIATEVSEDSHYPVLLVPPAAVFQPAAAIVFATDYQESLQEASLQSLKLIADSYSSKVFIATIETNGNKIDASETKVKHQLDSIFADNEHIFISREDEDIVDGLNKVLDRTGASLVAISPRRLTFPENIFHKRLTKKLAFHSHVPVLVLPSIEN